ncbi:MAG: hypothetical protein A3J54_02370 [Candidatus Ryanbacteria bacterium RIFCSPHIGHO2_02_FULL_45_13b]|uniref:NAD-dependent epimerase/dehydratase domain-containing protein n=1 Tax=Candidatus Ryanbacteria bacterium RIFCSPHIGHO2_02_FULL_45_13b TaxID=1802117 RepID=A0A1G2GC40_9BACT|nr:MAG: hypothetical protein A3J54_02370 [Candidatus Ryanbacteria bacterium RIFCSPHIGHO2_02_FULL_45_13b]
MNVLITGATGFVGANLAHRLVKKGNKVHCVVRPKSDMWRIRSIKEKIVTHNADLSDARAIERVVKNVHPQVIYHMAAHGLFLKQEEAHQMISSTILGTVHLFEALHKCNNVGKIISMGSFAEYDPTMIHISEQSRLQPANAYGVSKASQSFFAQYYARFYKMPIVIMRHALLYGAYEEARRLVPAAMLAHMRKEPLNLSSPRPRKDFLFMEDALDALELVVKKNIAPGEIINIGTGMEHTVRDVITMVQRVSGVRVPLRWDALERRQWDSPRRHVFETTQTRILLHWRPRHTLEKGIQKTWDWFRNNHHLYE